MRTSSRPCLRGLQRFAAAPTGSAAAARPRRPPPAAAYCFCRFSSSSPSSASDSATSPPPPPQKQTAANGPRATLDLRHIRQNPDLYADNCRRRNYGAMAEYPARIVALFAEWQARQRDGRSLREAANAVRRQLANAPGARDAADESLKDEAAAGSLGEDQEKDPRAGLLEQARALKQQLAAIEADETALAAEMQRLAAALPNLTSAETPDGPAEGAVLSYINCEPGGHPTSPLTGAPLLPDAWRSHVHIGRELGLLDFAAAATASGWGWYYLLGDGARLEQALVQYALAVAHRHGWALVSPPSVVRSGIAAACGFQPRDQGGEQQTYALEGLPLSLTATAEIPLAALYAEATIEATAAEEDREASERNSDGDVRLPLRRAAVSRCYRAEAGARGASTRGLYRVHEFTKVELFAWTAPDLDSATEAFDELVDIQTEILSSLGLPCRVLEMPATDLGASAFRKVDIEAFFPGRVGGVDGNNTSPGDLSCAWGEVTSASLCTDYQTRRLGTRARIDGGALTFPWTLNGTALAVPRVLAALLENGWDEEAMTVAVPECLRPWMDGQDKIGLKHRLR